MRLRKRYLLFFIGLMLVGGLFFRVNQDSIENVQAAEVSVPTFSKQSGCYENGFSLELKASEGSKIYYTTDGSIPEVPTMPVGTVSKIPKKEIAKEYTNQILVKNRQGEENVLSSKENVNFMYGGPEAWKKFDPNKDDVAKATVIRAVAVDTSGNRSNVVTKTYFVGNDIYNKYKNASIISMVTDPDNLLSEETGIYRVGNYENKGSEWERDAFVEYFEDDGTIPFATTMGIRIHGGYTRHFGQKSFNLYFREELGGLKNLKNYELIPGNTNFDKTESINKYKHFMLRNGGNDTEYTKLQDVFIQSLVTDRAFTTQSNRVSVLFLNGEYWGPYSLTEKYSDNYAEENFGVNKDNVIMIKNGELEEGVDSDIQYYNELSSFAQKDMTNSNNYLTFCDMVDIQSFADYFATEAYIGNKDWPNNNEQLWRCRQTEEGNKYADTKWRWMLFDTEYSMNLYNQTGNDFDGIENAKSNTLFKAVLKNQDFQKLFVNTMMDLYNVNFIPNTTDRRLEQYIEIYRPLMEDYYKRFGGGDITWAFNNNIDRMKSFMNDRRNNMLLYLNNQFNTGNAVSVTLTSSIKMKELITVNTTKPNMESGSWTGKYFGKYPIVLKANVPTGCQFDRWEVTGGSVSNASNTETTVTLTSSSTTVQAKFTGTPVVTPSPTPAPTRIPPTPIPGSTSEPSLTSSPSPTPAINTTPKPIQTQKPPVVSSAPLVKRITVPKAVISSITGKKKALTVKIKKITGAKGYEVVYATDKKFKKSRKVALIRNSIVTFKKLKSKKIYYLKARAYMTDSKGKKVYGKYSVVKSKKVK